MVEVDVPSQDAPDHRQDSFVVDEILEEGTIGNEVRIKKKLARVVSSRDLPLEDSVGELRQGSYALRERAPSTMRMPVSLNSRRCASVKRCKRQEGSIEVRSTREFC